MAETFGQRKRGFTIALAFWCVAAAAVLLVSIAVHVSTFMGIDPMNSFPGVILIHITIFPPFFAAIWYANKMGLNDSTGQKKLAQASPRWMRWASYIFFAYAMVNFVTFMILSETGSPNRQDGNYFLMDHGHIVRQLTESEFHQQQAYIVRGFSGHWMLFASAALTMMVGVGHLRATQLPPCRPAQ